jgi:hypothetical protein
MAPPRANRCAHCRMQGDRGLEGRNSISHEIPVQRQNRVSAIVLRQQEGRSPAQAAAPSLIRERSGTQPRQEGPVVAPASVIGHGQP